MIIFRKTNETCTEERHVWFTDTIPPDDLQKCECGKTTWQITEADLDARLDEYLAEHEKAEAE
jgi:hypothetical protein